MLSGETHEQERIIQHFSHRYHDSNPSMFATAGNPIVLLLSIVIMVICRFMSFTDLCSIIVEH